MKERRQHVESVKSVIESVSARGFANALRARHPETYAAVRQEPGDTVAEQAYRLLHGDPECEVCEREPSFVSLAEGFNTFCSTACAAVAQERKETLTCRVCEGEFGVILSKAEQRVTCSPECQAVWLSRTADQAARRRRETVRERYGVDNVFELGFVVEKSKRTRLERYGDASFNNRDAARETSLERYGVEHPMRDAGVAKRVARTQRDRHGGVGLASADIARRAEETNLDRHGTDTPQRLSEVKQRAADTCQRKYGGQGMASEELRERIESTNKDRYGYRVASKSDEVRARVSASKRRSKLSSLLSHPTFERRFEARFTEAEYAGVRGYREYPFTCKRCGIDFEDHLKYVTPRCPECDRAESGTSAPERDLADRLEQAIESPCTRNDRSALDGQEIDVLFPERGLAVEFDGLYWHGEARGGKSKRYHLEKTLACAEQGICLVHVFEDEWIDRPEVVVSRLSAMAGAPVRSIGARECEVRRLSVEEARAFFDRVHLQGFRPSTVHMGLAHDGGIVQAASFSRRPQLSGEGWELTRLAAQPGARVQGGASRLVHHGMREASADALTSFADRRWTPVPGDTVYEAVGFELTSVSAPGYWYVTGPGERRHRYGFAKHTLRQRLDSFDPEMTEWENMRHAGYDRVWDCGQLRYEMRL